MTSGRSQSAPLRHEAALQLITGGNLAELRQHPCLLDLFNAKNDRAKGNSKFFFETVQSSTGDKLNQFYDGKLIRAYDTCVRSHPCT